MLALMFHTCKIEIINSRDRSAMSSPSQIKENLYATLPRSLKSELAVTTKIQDPEVVQERREMVAKKSVNELSQVTTLSDVPIPSPIQKMIDTAQHINDPKPEGYGYIFTIRVFRRFYNYTN